MIEGQWQVLDSGYVQTSSGNIYYEVAGRGRPLVLIHAGRIDGRMWDEQFELFSKTHRVIRYDVKGYGSSNGGSIAIEFTLAYPKMVVGLVLAATSISGYERSGEDEQKVWDGLGELWKREEELMKHERFSEVVELEVETWHKHVPLPAREKLTTLHLENTRAYKTEPWKFHVAQDRPAFKRLSEIRAPTLIIIGDLDLPGLQIMNERLHSMIPHSRKLTIHGADHILNMSKPAEFNKAVLEFANSLDQEVHSPSQGAGSQR